jgi:hypothetical protein
VIGNQGDDMPQIGFRIEAIELGRAHQAIQDGSPPPGIRTCEDVVLRPIATVRSARSAALLSISMRLSVLYHRTDLLEQRRELMSAWAIFVTDKSKLADHSTAHS